MKSRVKILYLYRYLSINGFDYINCRKLIQSLNKHFTNVDLRWGILPEDEYAKLNQEWMKNETISENDFFSAKYRVLIIEDILNVESKSRSSKVRASTLKKFQDDGGIVIFNFREEDKLLNPPGIGTYNAFLSKAGLPQIRQPESREQFPDQRYFTHLSHHKLVRGYDEDNMIKGKNGFYFRIKVDNDYLEYISREMRPAFQGVSQLVAIAPLEVKIYSGILLAGNPSTTKMLSSGDLWWDGSLFHVFGSYNDIGSGCSVTITGSICSDTAIEMEQTDGIQFVINLINLLLNYQSERLRFYEPKDKVNIITNKIPPTFTLNKPVFLEENRLFEFKEIKGQNPGHSIQSIADQYAVAFLNREGGSIFWGVRDIDRVVVGIKLDYSQRDEIRRVVTEKLTQIQPPIAPSSYRIEIHSVHDEGKLVPDLCVVELSVPQVHTKDLYATGKNEVYIKTDAGKKKLTISEIQAEILKRNNI